jgi:hypothetical protein
MQTDEMIKKDDGTQKSSKSEEDFAKRAMKIKCDMCCKQTLWRTMVPTIDAGRRYRYCGYPIGDYYWNRTWNERQESKYGTFASYMSGKPTFRRRDRGKK